MRPIKFRDEFGCVLELTRRPGTQQFVGYDCDGNEVYEGDTLVDKEGNGFTARLVCRVLDDEGFLLDIPLEQLKLTEATT